MTIQARILGAVAVSGFAALLMATQANALTAQECSAKYQAAKAAGTLGDQKWNDFRKAQCGADAAPAPAAAAAPAAEPKEAAKTSKKEAKDAAKEAAAPAAPAGPAVYPNAVDAKYAKEKPAKQRMQTCLDQYNANKAGNGNGGMKWIQKGGGHYSECNKKLKGSA
jgi:hypothetical protein